MQICSLSSGSKGNCTLIRTENTNILIDLGISYSEMKARLKEIGFSGSIDGVLVTHTHADHIKGLAVFVKREPDALIYAPKNLWRTLGGQIKAEIERCRSFDSVFRVGDIDVLPFATSHDVPCCGYTLDCDGERLSVVTDLGHVTDRILSGLDGSSVVLLESNYDEQMLIGGSYPYPLKMRILGERGHLSNQDCAVTAAQLVRSGVKKIILAHISENNNLYDLAYETTCKHLTGNGIEVGRDVEIYVARQDRPSEIIDTVS